MLEKIKIRKTSDSNYIKINLGNNFNLLGMQQNIDEYRYFESNNLVNSFVDEESRRYKFYDTTINIKFYFSDGSGNWENVFFNEKLFNISNSVAVSNNYDTVSNSFL